MHLFYENSCILQATPSIVFFRIDFKAVVCFCFWFDSLFATLIVMFRSHRKKWSGRIDVASQGHRQPLAFFKSQRVVDFVVSVSPPPPHHWFQSFHFPRFLLSCTHAKLSYQFHPSRHVYLPNLGIYFIGFAKSSIYIIWYPLYEQYSELIE